MDLKKLAWFFEDEVEQCRSTFASRNAEPDASAWLVALEHNLLRDLFALTHRVLIAQFKLIESQVGFDDFCTSLRQLEIRSYLHGRYPLLRQRINETCRAWLDQSCAISDRFAIDANAILEILLPGKSVPAIRKVVLGAGDSHRGGHCVAILEFCDGRSLVYKPRNLAIDTRFAEMLDWVNRRCATDLQVPAHIDRGSYGWVEFVAHAECADAEAVERFYGRIGSLLALLYILEGNDFHYENLIAAGEHPVLIDLESFFRPPFGSGDAELYDTSVLKVGLLPNRLASAGNMPEISGLSDAEGQLSLDGLILVKKDDDSFSLVRKRGIMRGARNVPLLDGARVELQVGYALNIKEGFERVYRAVLGDIDGFSELVESCVNSQVRVLFRNTVTYVHLQEEALHPSLMASEEATAKHYELLRLAVTDNPFAERFVDFEIADLHRGDVPMFTATAGSRELWYADDRYIDDFFNRSGLDMVRRNLRQLSLQDLEQQLWIIGNCFISHSASASAQGRARSKLNEYADDGSALDQQLITYASTVAAALREQMHITERSASWLVHLASSLDNSQFELVPAFFDIYGGIPGEVLFHSQLAQVTGNYDHMELAHKALDHLKQRLLESSAAIQAVGLYVGWGSVVRLMTTLAELENDYRHFEYLEELLSDRRFDELITMDRNFSIIKGTAGFMHACAELHIASGSARALELARMCAAHLIQHRWPESDAFAWRVFSAVPLSGLAHGSSGFAMAFARLYEATGDTTYRTVALSALDYERTLFLPEFGNWQDRRDYVVEAYGERPWCSVAWAHGAPGIGLARLALLRAGIDTLQIREELEIAVRTTLELGFDGNDSLIFGSFGNLELLICQAECFGPATRPELTEITSRLLLRVQEQGLRLSAPVDYPFGILAGATGVAYQCLRIARMHQVPSVLCGTSQLPSIGNDARMRARLRPAVSVSKASPQTLR